MYEMDSSGKSGSLFYYTHDKNYMMKTIPEREFDSLIEALPDYYAMIKKNPNSLLCRFYGLHRVEWRDSSNDKHDMYLVVMNNVFRSFKVGTRFDLKGSTAKRTQLLANQLPHEVGGTPLKDNDFTKHYKCLELLDTSASEDSSSNHMKDMRVSTVL